MTPYLSINNEVLKIPVGVLLHATGPGGHPPAQGGEFVRVGLMAHRVAARTHLTLQVLAYYTSLEYEQEFMSVLSIFVGYAIFASAHHTN